MDKATFDAQKLANRSAYNEKRARNDKLRDQNNGVLPQGHNSAKSFGRKFKRQFVTQSMRRGVRRRAKLNVAIPHDEQPWRVKEDNA